jgi:hypothetical protein
VENNVAIWVSPAFGCFSPLHPITMWPLSGCSPALPSPAHLSMFHSPQRVTFSEYVPLVTYVILAALPQGHFFLTSSILSSLLPSVSPPSFWCPIQQLIATFNQLFRDYNRAIIYTASYLFWIKLDFEPKWSWTTTKKIFWTNEGKNWDQTILNKMLAKEFRALSGHGGSHL